MKDTSYNCQTIHQSRTNLYRPRGKNGRFKSNQVRVDSLYFLNFGVHNHEYSFESACNSSMNSRSLYCRNDGNDLHVYLYEVEGGVKLKFHRVDEKGRQDEIFRRLYLSFEENNMTHDENDYYYPTFRQMADELKTLPVENEHVAIDHQDGTITFFLYLGKGLLLTVSKAAVQPVNDNDIMFSIALNKKVMVVDRMSFYELKKKVEKTYSELV